MNKFKVCEMCNYYYDESYINSDYPNFCENCSIKQMRFQKEYDKINYINFLRGKIAGIHNTIDWCIKQYSKIGSGYDINREKEISEYNILINLYQQEIDTLSHLNAYGNNINRKELKEKARRR